MKKIIYLSSVNLKDVVKQRPQHFIDYFASSGFDVLYINMNLELIIHENYYDELLVGDNIFKYIKERDNHVYTLDTYVTSDPGKRFNRILKHLTELYGINNVVIMTCFPRAAEYVDLLDSTIPVIYDCVDDWEGFTNYPKLCITNDLIAKERKLAKISDMVIVSSKRLYLKMKQFNKNVYYLPNGVNTSDYINSDSEDKLKNINQPIILFIGALSEWIDYDLLNYLIKSRPSYSFVFVGPYSQNSKLLKPGNVHMIGPKPYEELPFYMKSSTLGIIPFRIEKLTLSVTALKFFEYLAAGLPVVSTFLPDLIDIQGTMMHTKYEDILKDIDFYVNLNEKYRPTLRNICINESKNYDWQFLLSGLKNMILEQRWSNHDYHVEDDMIFVYERFKEEPVVRNELLHLYNDTKQFSKSLDIIKTTEKVDFGEKLYTYYSLNKYDEIYKEIKKAGESEENPSHIYLNTMAASSISINVIYAYILKECNRYDEAIKLTDGMLGENISDSDKIYCYSVMTSCLFALNENESAYKILSNMLVFKDVDINKILEPDILLDYTDYLIDNCNLKEAEMICLELVRIHNKHIDDLVTKQLSKIYLQNGMSETQG